MRRTVISSSLGETSVRAARRCAGHVSDRRIRRRRDVVAKLVTLVDRAQPRIRPVTSVSMRESDAATTTTAAPSTMANAGGHEAADAECAIRRVARSPRGTARYRARPRAPGRRSSTLEALVPHAGGQNGADTRSAPAASGRRRHSTHACRTRRPWSGRLAARRDAERRPVRERAAPELDGQR